MSILTKTNTAYGSTESKTLAQPIGGLAFDWLMILLSLIFIGGLYLDGWAHNHGKVDQSFFTIWHAFFYAGFALVAFTLVATLGIQWQRGYRGASTLPVGYQLSLLGIIIFGMGGVGDLIWHELFGIEKDFDALLSPSHLALGLGLGLVVSGPLRAAWARAGHQPTWRNLTPAILSLSALISALTFFMMFSHPLMSNIGGADHYEFNNETGQVAGVVSILLMTGLVCAPAYLALRRWRLPIGSLTLVWGINLAAMAVIDWQRGDTIILFGGMLLGAALADLLRIGLNPSLDNPRAWRIFGFGAPVLIFGAYFLALLATEGSRWTIHMLSGTVVLAGMVGWLLSYLIVPPPVPVEA